MQSLYEKEQPRYLEYLSFLYYSSTVFFIGRLFPLCSLTFLALIPAAALSCLLLYAYSKLLNHTALKGLSAAVLFFLSVFCGSLSFFCFTQFMNVCVLSELPKGLFPFALLLTVFLFLKKDVKVIERFSRLLGPFVLFLLILADISGFSKFTPRSELLIRFQELFTPFFFTPLPNSFLHSFFVFFLVYLTEGILLLSLFSLHAAKQHPNTKKPSPVFKETTKGLLISTVFTSATYLITVLVLGSGVFEQLTYPVYYPPGLTETAEYLERIEVILLAVFTFAEFIKLSVLAMVCKEALLTCTAFSSGLKEKKPPSCQ